MHREKEEPEERERRAKDSPKKDKKEKKEKKKHRKHHRTSSDQKAASRSKSKSRSRSLSPPKQKKPKESQIPKGPEPRAQQSIPARRGRVNSHLLTHIISDHKKINRKLDTQQVQRAASKFKQNFTEEISPVTMSAFLSNEALQRQIQAKQLTSDYDCRICGESFQNGSDFNDHMQSFHRHSK